MHLEKGDACYGQPQSISLETADGFVSTVQQVCNLKLACILQYSRLRVLMGIGIVGDKTVFFKHLVRKIVAEANFDLGTLYGLGRLIGQNLPQLLCCPQCP